MIKVVVFTGGNGNKNLINHLKNISNVELYLLINGYDDGLSTGIARRALGKMLGPSDFRKNLTYVLNDSNSKSRTIKELLEFRLKKNDVSNILIKGAGEFCINLFQALSLDEKENEFLLNRLLTGWDMILEYTKSPDDLIDFSIGNILISGCYKVEGNFNKALSSLLKNLEIEAKIINITDDKDNSRLIAITENNQIIFNEAEIVSFKGNAPLKDFIILDSDDLFSISQENCTVDDLYELQKVPKPSNEATNAIINADILIFGSGTLNSSLLPSYRILSSIINSSNSKKYLIVNNKYDNDIQNIDLTTYLNKHFKENIDSFNAIFLDIDSAIVNNNSFSNLVIKDFSSAEKKHNPVAIWNEIVNNLTLDIKINILISKNTTQINRDKYIQNIDYVSKVFSSISFNLIDENTKLEENEYVLILDTSGYFFLNDLVSWIYSYHNYSFDSIIGYRYFSRRQTILSFKGRYKDSFFTYYISKIFSYFVSFFYLLVSRQFIPDPFSGVYFFRVKKSGFFKNTGGILRYFKKNNYRINVSLPIHFVNSHNYTFSSRVKNFLINIYNLFKL